MTRTEQIELAKEWEALGKRMSRLKDELEELGLRQAEIENSFYSDIGTTLYQVLDDVEEGPEMSAVIHELAKRYPGTVDYEFEAEADVFNLLDENNNVIATISEQEMIDTLNLLRERSAKEGEEPCSRS